MPTHASTAECPSVEAMAAGITQKVWFPAKRSYSLESGMSIGNLLQKTDDLKGNVISECRPTCHTNYAGGLTAYIGGYGMPNVDNLVLPLSLCGQFTASHVLKMQ